MKLHERGEKVVSAQLQHSLKSIVDGVDSLITDITENSHPSQSIQRFIYLTRTQEEQSINKAYENIINLNTLVERLAEEQGNLKLIGDCINELV